MQQVFHSNAVTNIHIRNEIRNSNLTNLELDAKFHTSVTTISKWKNRKDILKLNWFSELYSQDVCPAKGGQAIAIPMFFIGRSNLLIIIPI